MDSKKYSQDFVKSNEIIILDTHDILEFLGLFIKNVDFTSESSYFL
jgi:hypothetical protein